MNMYMIYLGQYRYLKLTFIKCVWDSVPANNFQITKQQLFLNKTEKLNANIPSEAIEER